MHGALDFMNRFINEEGGQAISEYGSLIAWCVCSFAVAMGVMYGIQHGFVNLVGGIMSNHMMNMSNHSDPNMYTGQ